MKAMIRAFMTAALLVTLGAAAHAQNVTVSFKGTITEQQDSPFPEIAVGTPFTGYYTYDLASTPFSTHPSIAYYYHAGEPYGITVTIAGRTFKTNPAHGGFYLQIANDWDEYFVIRDIYAVFSSGNPDVDGKPVTLISWQLQDFGHTALSSLALPSTAPALSQFATIQEFSVSGENATVPYYVIRGQIQQVQLGAGLYEPPGGTGTPGPPGFPGPPGP
jgi:hypothetical protein